MAYETLILEIEEHVALLKLNRPETMNALNAQLTRELCDALRANEANEKVRCTLLYGSEKTFAAGSDVSDLAERSFVDVFANDHASLLNRTFMDCRKPVIAAVAGYALGAGCELAMMCDFIIAGESAKFGQPEIKMGVTSAMGGTQRLTRAVGKAKAMDMHLTGRSMTAEEAERAGLVSRVVPTKKVMEESRAAAQKIAAQSRVTAMAVKEAVNRSFETSLSEGILHERRLFHAMFATSDQREGMEAFLEKRDPQFRDK